MKCCLALYLHSASAEDALDCLRSNEVVTGFTLIHCEGHSTEHHGQAAMEARDQVVGFVPRVRIEVILDGDAVEGVLQGLRTCLGSGKLQGIWTLTELRDSGRLS